MSIMSSKALDRPNCWGYAFSAPAKSGVGICNPDITRAHNTRLACFFVPHSHTLSMVGCMGAEQSAPGSLVTGIANPVQSATSKICNFCGGNIKPTREDAAMLATTPTPSHPQIVYLPYVCAVEPSESMFIQSIRKTEQYLLDRVKDALDEAGVAWIDIRTKERSKPAATDSEGCDNAQ
ncbi:ash family protein [Salmonella enterica]|nr:ash family protein [Salmonella enterica]